MALTFSHQLEASYYAVELEIEMIQLLESKKEQLLERIKTYLAQNPDESFVKQIELIQTIPGVGFVSAV